MQLRLLCLMFPIIGCSASTNTDSAQRTDSGTRNEAMTDPSSGPSLSISLKEGDLIFRYFEKGMIKVVTSIDEVPADKRHAVYVDDLKVSPTERQSNRYLQRYDLSQVTEDGRYQGTPVLRAELEAQIERLRPKPTDPRRQTPEPQAKRFGPRQSHTVFDSVLWVLQESEKVSYEESDPV